MRLFIALNMPESERERLYQALAPLREAGIPVRWLPAESMHLTLKFLGEVRPNLVARIEQAMAAAAEKSTAFQVAMGGFGAFPTLRQPRVLWLRVDASPALRCLKHDIEWEMAPLGFEREVRAFTPHITIARAQSDAGAGDFRDLDRLLAKVDYEGELSVEALDLMRSQLTPAGARYERISRVPLAGAPARTAAEDGVHT